MPRAIGQVDAAVLGGRLWQLDSLRPKFVHRWQAREVVGTTLPELVTGTMNITLASTAPTLAIRKYNRKALVYGGTEAATLFNLSGVSNSLPASNSNSTVAFVWDQTAGGTRKFFEWGAFSGAGQLRTVGIRSGGIDVGTSGSGNDHTTSFASTGPTIGVWELIGSTKGSSVWGNGDGTAQTATLSSTVNTGNDRIYLANHLGSSEKWNGDWFDVIIFAGTLTTAERNKVEGLLAWTYGLDFVAKLPALHPFKNRPPLIGD